MEQILNDIDFLSAENDVPSVKTAHPDEPFSERAILFLSSLAFEINSSPLIRAYPDVASFAFFCRKANLLMLKKSYDDNLLRLGRGIVFHIAPSNVPVNFAYSLVAGILSGNLNLVRIPSKEFPQVDIICEAIKKVIQQPENSYYHNRIFLFRYGKDQSVTSFFSSLCDVRIIWGGDDTINQIRKSPIPSRAFDITFADRYSFCIINADEFIKEQHTDTIVTGFYNDTYLFDQNACSAPHLVIWTGKNVAKAKDIFWTSLQKVIEQKEYQISEVVAVGKWTSLLLQSVNCQIKKEKNTDNRLMRVTLLKLPSNIEQYRCIGGYFSEYTAFSINEIRHIVNRKYQTMSYYGFTKQTLMDILKDLKLNGIDRVVPIGKTTDFSLKWDGYDLIRSLSRECCF